MGCEQPGRDEVGQIGAPEERETQLVIVDVGKRHKNIDREGGAGRYCRPN